ncbi:MAG: transporter [Pseudomonadales bacterium]
MKRFTRYLGKAAVSALSAVALSAGAQELEPRIYTNIPIDQNFLGMVYGYTEGAVNPAGDLPLEDGNLKYTGLVVAYFRTMSLGDKLAKVDGNIHYSCISGSALLDGEPITRDACTQGDLRLRFSYNFLGSPALSLQQFAAAEKQIAAGVSLQVSVPTGGYESDKLINIGANRWFIKPGIGVSIPWRKWSIEFAASVKIFSENDDYLGEEMQQDPVYNLQTHLIYDIARRHWLAFDANIFIGGDMEVGGSPLPPQEDKSRLGITWGITLNRQHAIKLSAHTGALTRVGNDSDALSVGWTYRWD